MAGGRVLQEVLLRRGVVKPRPDPPPHHKLPRSAALWTHMQDQGAPGHSVHRLVEQSYSRENRCQVKSDQQVAPLPTLLPSREFLAVCSLQSLELLTVRFWTQPQPDRAASGFWCCRHPPPGCSKALAPTSEISANWTLAWQHLSAVATAVL